MQDAAGESEKGQTGGTFPLPAPDERWRDSCISESRRDVFAAALAVCSSERLAAYVLHSAFDFPLGTTNELLTASVETSRRLIACEAG